MRFILLQQLLLLTASALYSQLQDSFNDSNFTSNPKWYGDTSHFKVIDESLNLNAPSISDSAFLCTSSAASVNALWEYSISMYFNPSSSNFAHVFIMSAGTFGKADFKAYSVKMGGKDDEVSLYKWEGKSQIEIIDGDNSTLSKSINHADIRVSRNQFSEWQLWLDTSQTGNYKLMGQKTDDFLLRSEKLMIFCKYTSSRSDKFSFDNFLASGDVFQDSIAPSLIDFSIVDEYSIDLIFDDEINNPGGIDLLLNGSAVQSQSSKSQKNILRLSFDTAFIHGQFNTLEVKGITDTSENMIHDTLIEFVYNNPNEYKLRDIVFNELMIDESPPKSLPECEYIEIVNRSENIIDLSNFILSDLRDSIALPLNLLYPDSIIVLIDESCANDLCQNPKFICLDNMLNLNNDGDIIRFFAFDERVIDSLQYDSEWTSMGKEGGISLERINPNYFCNDTINWKASRSPSGGTPGKTNSVHEIEVKHIDNLFDEVISNRDSVIEIRLQNGILNTNHWNELFRFNPRIDFDAHYLKTFPKITFQTPNLVEENEIWLYSSNVHDCFDLSLSDDSILIFKNSDESNILINEVLFKTDLGKTEYLELYNNGDVSVNLEGWEVGLIKLNGDTITKSISNEYKILPPQAYILLNEDSIALQQRPGKTENLYQMDLPSLPNDASTLILVDEHHQIVDFMHYSEKFHSPLLRDNTGVSLERVAWHISSMKSSNWQSASSQSYYGTPGFENSQKLLVYHSDNILDIYPEIFSPDNDGYQDHLQINIKPKKSGFIGNLEIYHSGGKRIRNLLNQDLLGSTNSYIWDGLDNDGNTVPVGYYLIVLKGFHPDGEVLIRKKSVVVAQK